MATRKTAKKSAIKPSMPARKDILIALLVAGIVILLGLFRNQFVVANVNGKQISRIDLIRELEKKDGKTVLESMVTEQLILQEAERKNITVSDQEIDTEIKNIEKSVTSQGQNLEQLLAAQNMTRDDLKKQIKLQLILKKIAGGNVTVSDKEVDDYLAKNQESFPPDSNPEELKKQVKQQLEQQKLSDKIQEVVANLQKNGKVEYLLPL